MMEAKEFYEFLHGALKDRGATALNAVAKCAAENRELEIKGPCIAALVCWGEAGLESILDIALSDRTSKNISAAIKAYSALASGQTISRHSAFIIDETTVERINEHLRQTDMTALGKKYLSALVMSLPTDDLLIPLGVAFTQIGIADPNIASEIVAAISNKWLEFGTRELSAFEELITTAADDEPALHNFLEQYPQILDPMAVEVWSKPDFHGVQEPDFLIRRSDDTYLVVEIETPAKQLITQSNQPSAQVTQAVRQVIDYRSFLAEHIQEALSHFPNISDPDALVVIGMETGLTDAQRRALARENQSRNKLRVAGFDWLVSRARTILSNATASKVLVHKRYRMN